MSTTFGQDKIVRGKREPTRVASLIGMVSADDAPEIPI